MSNEISQTLYIDMQAEIPAAFCEKCHGEVYAPSFICLRCQQDVP